MSPYPVSELFNDTSKTIGTSADFDILALVLLHVHGSYFAILYAYKVDGRQMSNLNTMKLSQKMDRT